MAICPNCSNYLKDHYEFCPNGGTKLSRNKSENKIKTSQETQNLEEITRKYALEAQSLEDLGNHTEALKYWNKIIEITPNNDFYIFGKGLCLYDLNKYDLF